MSTNYNALVNTHSFQIGSFSSDDVNTLITNLQTDMEDPVNSKLLLLGGSQQTITKAINFDVAGDDADDTDLRIATKKMVRNRIVAKLDELRSSDNTFTGINIYDTIRCTQDGSALNSLTRKEYVDNANTSLQNSINAKVSTSTYTTGLATKQNTLTSTTDVTVNDITLHGKIVCNTSGALVGNNELSYLDGVTSAIQTQLDGKQPLITDNSLTIARTNGLQTSLNAKQATIGATTDLSFRDLTCSGVVTLPNNSLSIAKINTLQSALDARPTLTTLQNGLTNLAIDQLTCNTIVASNQTIEFSEMNIANNEIPQVKIDGLVDALAGKQSTIGLLTDLSFRDLSASGTITIPNSSLTTNKISGLDTALSAKASISYVDAQILGISLTAGPTGSQGIQGSIGATGPTGMAGSNGSNGSIGATGPTGLQGIQGIQGNAGLDGADGAVGATGPTGSQGIAGNNGSIGATGPTGSQGIQGIQGNAGADGSIGATGPTGSQGVAGSNGSNGSIGPTGPAGVFDNNSDLTIATGKTLTLIGNIAFQGTAITISPTELQMIDNCSSNIQSQIDGLTASTVKTSGNETVAGIKTFSSPPVISGASIQTATIPDSALASTFVKTSGNETVAGIKTFSSPPVLSGASITSATIADGALASTFVKTSGNETVAGIKTFSSPPVLSGASITSATIPTSAISSGALTLTNLITNRISENYVAITSGTNAFTLDYSAGSLFYLTTGSTLSANFSIQINNLGSSTAETKTVTLLYATTGKWYCNAITAYEGSGSTQITLSSSTPLYNGGTPSISTSTMMACSLSIVRKFASNYCVCDVMSYY